MGDGGGFLVRIRGVWRRRMDYERGITGVLGRHVRSIPCF